MENRDKLMKEIGENEMAFPLTFKEWEDAAKEKMITGGYQYVSKGAGSEETAKRNRTALEKWSIIPRMLNDVSTVDVTTELLGNKYASPFLLSPIGMQKLAHTNGEIATAQACKKFMVPFILSTVSSCSIEEVAEVSNGPKWFQLYWSHENPEVSYSMIHRAEKAGYEAIVVTVDTVMAGWREGDMKAGFSPLSLGYGSGNYKTDPVFMASLKDKEEQSIIEEILTHIQHPQLTWDAIAEIKKRTTLPIILKGILHKEDALLAVKYDVDGIIVSNHGGRQLDGVIASIDALAEIKEVIDKQIPILFDSGVRRGVDAVKALAIGADAVCIGRPYLYGLAAHGKVGVEKVIERFIQETEVTLGLAGIARLAEIERLGMKREK